MKSISAPLVGILSCIAGIAVAVSLLSYTAADPPEFRGFPPSEMIRNYLGLPGAIIAAGLLIPFGYAAYLVIVPFGFHGIRLLCGFPLRRRLIDFPVMQTAGLLLAAAGCAGLFTFLPDWLLKLPCPLMGPGGYSGTILTMLLAHNFSTAGIVIFLTSMVFAGLVLFGDLMLFQLLTLRRRNKIAEETQPKIIKVAADSVLLRNARSRIKFDTADEYEEEREEEAEYEHEEYDYELPSADLLEPSEAYDDELYNDVAHERAQLLEKVLLNFKIKAQVVNIQKGPVITQYELRLEKGTRIKQIQQLQDDLGVELKTGSVRIVAPIPGKNTVGVELPNKHSQTVKLRDVMDCCPEAAHDFALPLFLGKGVTGDPMVTDLTKMPHLLIAGQTGTGKSVCLNAIIVSMLMTRSPEEVRILMVDPKRVEFGPYHRIPHLLHPVVDDMQKAPGVLSWVADQMEDRFDLFKRAVVKNLAEYNKLSEDDLRRRMNMIDADDEEWGEIPQTLPYLVVIIDEVADLIQSTKEVEAHIIRLTQKSRAAGIHLILATQKPTRDVFTSLIKTNLPARIAFRVSSKMDSMVILDRVGAEQLLGRGDMLFSQNNEIIRGQGAYVAEEEIDAINEQIGTDEPDFDKELLELDTFEEEDDAEENERYDDRGRIDRDDLYRKAVDLVIQKGRGSVSMLQTCLGIGYPRASRMMDFMEEDGVVGKANGAKPRSVLMSMGDWRRKCGGNQPRHARAFASLRRDENYYEEDEYVAM